MNKKLKAWILIILYGGITVTDCVLTYKGTPNLAFEANPLVANLGFGWFGLIACNLAVFIIYSLLVYYSFAVYKEPVIHAISAKEYRRKIDDATGWRSHVAMLGYALSYSLIIARLLPVYDWLCLLGYLPMSAYHQIKNKFPLGRPDLFVSVILALIFAVIWLANHYKLNFEKIHGGN